MLLSFVLRLLTLIKKWIFFRSHMHINLKRTKIYYWKWNGHVSFNPIDMDLLCLVPSGRGSKYSISRKKLKKSIFSVGGGKSSRFSRIQSSYPPPLYWKFLLQLHQERHVSKFPKHFLTISGKLEHKKVSAAAGKSLNDSKWLLPISNSKLSNLLFVS